MVIVSAWEGTVLGVQHPKLVGKPETPGKRRGLWGTELGTSTLPDKSLRLGGVGGLFLASLLD